MQHDGRLDSSHAELGFGGPVSWQPPPDRGTAGAPTAAPSSLPPTSQPTIASPFADYQPGTRRFQSPLQTSIAKPDPPAILRPVLYDPAGSNAASSHPRRFANASPPPAPPASSAVGQTGQRDPIHVQNPITAALPHNSTYNQNLSTTQSTAPQPSSPSPIRSAINPFQSQPPNAAPPITYPTIDHNPQTGSTVLSQPYGNAQYNQANRHQQATSSGRGVYSPPPRYEDVTTDEEARVFLNPAHEARAPLNRPGSLPSDYPAAQPVSAAARVAAAVPRQWSRNYPSRPKNKGSSCFCRIFCWALTIMLAIALAVGVYVGVKLYRQSKAPKGINPNRTVDANPAGGGPAICDSKGVLSTISSSQRQATRDYTRANRDQPLQTSTTVLHIKFNREVDPVLQEVVKAANASVGPNLDLQSLTPQQISVFLTDKFTGAWIDPKYNSWLSDLVQHAGPADLDIVKSIKHFYYGSYANVLIVEFEDVNPLQFNALITLLEARKDVIQWVHADKQVRQLETLTQANDPNLGNQWGINAVGVLQQSGLTVPPAWTVTTGSRNIIVAVMDTGVDTGHPDLLPNLWVNQAEQNGEFGVDDDKNGMVDDIHGWNFVDDNSQVSDPEGHGTHVTGIIAAVANNGLYGAGVAPVVSIMVLKVLNSMGDGWTSALYKGMEYALEKGAHITSHSLGSTGQDPTLQEIVVKAQQAGQLLVAAAGNNRDNNDVTPTYPASYDLDNVISVGWMDRFGCFAQFGNYGKNSVHLMAPGSEILSTYPTYMTSPINIPGMAMLGGSSQATPHVAGAAALVLASWEAQGKNFNGQAKTVKQILLDSVDIDPLFQNYTITGGKLNVARALALASNTTLPPPSLVSGAPAPQHHGLMLWLAAAMTAILVQGLL